MITHRQTPVRDTYAPRRFCIKTYGCQMNVYDSELVKAILTKNGFRAVEETEEADVILLNTCAIRENAHQKVYQHIQAFKRLKQQRPIILGVLGCMATNLRKDLLEDRRLNVDLVVGPDSYKRLPHLIREAAQTGAKGFDVTLSEFETYADIYPTRSRGVNAWVAVMRGCNNFCSFCVVPYTRGRERSRPLNNVVEECRRLAEEGFVQVTLLGQNVNSYHDGEHDFADLLAAVARIRGIERIRFTSPHPKDFPEKLLHLMAGEPKICKHIHLPLQAGSDRILDLMNRTYTQDEYLKLVDTIRRIVPDVTLTTDVIAGFPTETEEDFRETVKVMDAVGFESAFIFKYSQRRHTIAERKYPDDVPDEIKADRVSRLVAHQRSISLRLHRAMIGRTVRVLIEKDTTAKGPHQQQARSDGNTIVVLPAGSGALGSFFDVCIVDATPNVLIGEPPHPPFSRPR